MGLLPVVVAVVTGCRVARPSELPSDEPWIVAVKSCRIPEWESDIAQFAHHTWFDLKLGDESSWERVEVLSAGSGVQQSHVSPLVARHDLRFDGREVRLLQTITGDRARAVAARIQELGRAYSDGYRSDYAAWPGPNSNTFVSDVAANTDGLSFPLHHNAVGKDYPGWFDVGQTTTKTGLRVDTLPIGFALGAREGVELHVLQLTFGLTLFPPRLELPFLPELPWSSDVPARIPPPADATNVMSVDDPGETSLRMSTTLREPEGTFVFDYENAGLWLAVTVDSAEGVAEAGSAGSLEGAWRVIERACDGRTVRATERRVERRGEFTPLLVDAPLGDARASLALRRLPKGAWTMEFSVTGGGVSGPPSEAPTGRRP